MATDRHEKNDGAILRYTLMATAFSLVANLVIYAIGRGAGWIPDDMPNSTETFSLFSVILASVLPVLLFGGLMYYLSLHAPRASRLFTMIVLVVLIIAIAIPLVLRDIDGSFRLVLVAMHIVTAGSALALTQATTR